LLFAATAERATCKGHGLEEVIQDNVGGFRSDMLFERFAGQPAWTLTNAELISLTLYVCVSVCVLYINIQEHFF
jgi:hypothetical protein